MSPIDRPDHDLQQRLAEALYRHHGGPHADPGGITCDLCNDAQWWADNGFTEDERQAACGPQGIKCDGFGDKHGDGG